MSRTITHVDASDVYPIYFVNTITFTDNDNGLYLTHSNTHCKIIM